MQITLPLIGYVFIVSRHVRGNHQNNKPLNCLQSNSYTVLVECNNSRYTLIENEFEIFFLGLRF